MQTKSSFPGTTCLAFIPYMNFFYLVGLQRFCHCAAMVTGDTSCFTTLDLSHAVPSVTARVYVNGYEVTASQHTISWYHSLQVWTLCAVWSYTCHSKLIHSQTCKLTRKKLLGNDTEQKTFFLGNGKQQLCCCSAFQWHMKCFMLNCLVAKSHVPVLQDARNRVLDMVIICAIAFSNATLYSRTVCIASFALSRTG
jgi:hypothetical protein